MSRLGLSLVALACLIASASADPFTYRAVIAKFGELGRHGGGVVSSVLVSRGNYQVDFESNIDACTIVATIGRATTAGGTDWNAAFVSAQAAGANSSTVIVHTGDMRGRPRDHAFDLLVACP